jgi:hypothetical protein
MHPELGNGTQWTQMALERQRDMREIARTAHQLRSAGAMPPHLARRLGWSPLRAVLERVSSTRATLGEPACAGD